MTELPHWIELRAPFHGTVPIFAIVACLKETARLRGIANWQMSASLTEALAWREDEAKRLSPLN